ncbi:E1 ubiquitin-activating protein, partial [Sarracenia purpurea var. burkii]
SSDQAASESSIPLSPQWLYAKPSETKTATILSRKAAAVLSYVCCGSGLFQSGRQLLVPSSTSCRGLVGLFSAPAASVLYSCLVLKMFADLGLPVLLKIFSTSCLFFADLSLPVLLICNMWLCILVHLATILSRKAATVCSLQLLGNSYNMQSWVVSVRCGVVLVALEVVKACSGKFHPLFQFFYFDSVESLPTEPLEPSDFRPLNCRYDSQISVFGLKLQKKLEVAKVFVVGSGALGCEFLKNLALMGVSCNSPGKLTITDDDVIEKSNLSRQFLFRDWNIGQAKSTVAASAAAAINPNLRVVINALDNVNARLYVDKRCLYFQKPLLESGTLGEKCNTQMVIPHLTENYGASRDPPEKQAPMCTVHSFPHNIDHCLTWARSEFEGLLEKTPAEVTFLSNPSEYASSMRNAGDAQARDNLERILECLDRERCETFQDCIMWARLKFGFPIVV